MTGDEQIVARFMIEQMLFGTVKNGGVGADFGVVYVSRDNAGRSVCECLCRSNSRMRERSQAHIVS
jgi:hypothetical protein